MLVFKCDQTSVHCARSFSGVQIALFSAGGSISKKFGPVASKAGATVRKSTSLSLRHAARATIPCSRVFSAPQPAARTHMFNP